MGRATVISGGTDGRYVIEMDYGLAERDERVTKLDALLAALEIRKAAQQSEVDGFQAGLDLLQAQVTPLIEAYRAALEMIVPVPGLAEGIRKNLDTLTAKIIKQQLLLAQAQNALAHTELEIKQATLDRAALLALEIIEQRPAWCADFTVDAAGAVATLEVPGESGLILIYPGALAPDASDGVLTAREIQSPEQVFWNAAVLPGWQKFLPTYRRGTITVLDAGANTCTVQLAEALSSAQRLDVNQAETLSAVPIQYMDCHAAVFNVGDAVIVEFAGQDWDSPIVIGFVDHPKECAFVLSGVTKGGSIVTLPGPPALAVLRAYKPTVNAWQYPLRSDPGKSPYTFSDEPALAKAGNQYAQIFPSMYSGQMARVVQILLGRGVVVNYASTWASCHGVLTGSDGKPRLVEISALNGVMVMRLPVTAASASSPVDAVAHAVADFGGVPTGAAMPSGAALTAALANGTVVRLLTAAEMSEVFNKTPYTASMGWSFNAAGSEAHNTCWYTNEDSHVMGCHFKLSLSQSSATLELVSEGRLVHRLATLYGEFEEAPLLEEKIVAFSFDGGEVDLPRQTVSGLDVTEDINTTVFVCHIGSDLHKVDVQWHAYSAARDAFIQPQISTAFSGKLTMLTGWENCYDTIATAGTNYLTASAYGVCSPLVRDGYAIHEQARPVFNNDDNSYSFIAARTHVALPAGVFVTDRDDTTAALVFGGYRLLADVDRQFDPLCSMYGATDHYFYVLSVDTDQFIDGIGESAIAGDGLVGESLPPASAYNFIGYL